MATGLFLQNGPTLMEETAASRALEMAVIPFSSVGGNEDPPPPTHTLGSLSREREAGYLIIVQSRQMYT